MTIITAAMPAWVVQGESALNKGGLEGKTWWKKNTEREIGMNLSGMPLAFSAWKPGQLFEAWQAKFGSPTQKTPLRTFASDAKVFDNLSHNILKEMDAFWKPQLSGRELLIIVIALAGGPLGRSNPEGAKKLLAATMTYGKGVEDDLKMARTLYASLSAQQWDRLMKQHILLTHGKEFVEWKTYLD